MRIKILTKRPRLAGWFGVQAWFIMLVVGGEGLAQDPAPGMNTSIRRLTQMRLDLMRPMWAPDGSVLTFGRHESDGAHIFQYVMDPLDPEKIKRITDRQLPEYHGVFSPDGEVMLLVTVSQQGTQGNLDLSQVDHDGKNLKKIVGDQSASLSHQEWPAWAPDGGQFAFSSTHEGNQEIYIAKADGTDLKRITQSPGMDAHPCWTPDGKRIVFTTDRWGGLELASTDRDGGDVQRITHSAGMDAYPAVSPDGQWLAFVSGRDGNFEIYISKIDGTKPRNISNHPSRDTYPSWHPSGRSLIFVSDRGGDGTDLFEWAIEESANSKEPGG
jgi:TolB protein